MTDPAILPHQGLRVLDLTQHVAGQYCARLFADFGADVLLVEPTSGSATRIMEPLPTSSAPESASYLFRHLNGGKTRAVADYTSPEDLARLVGLAERADVLLIDTATPAQIKSGPKTILCRVSDFGQTGPYRHWTGGELIQQALSGVMSVTGKPDKSPLYGVGRRSAYATGVTAYISTLAALIWRDRTGESQEVEAITAEVTAAMGQCLVTQYGYSQTYATRAAYPGLLGQFQCQDGWLVLFAIRNWPAICRAFSLEDYADDPRFSTAVGLRRNWLQALELLRDQAAHLKVDETVAKLQAGKVSSERVLSLAELLKAKHFRVRDFWCLDDNGQVVALGPVLRTKTPTRAAPSPEPDTRGSMAVSLASWSAAPALARTPQLPAPTSPGSLPLQGLRVIDFTTAWAGPMAARSLAFLGADVIKIENASKLDAWRGPAGGMSDPASYPDRQAGDAPYDRQALFNTQNHDKRSIAVDLKKAEGVELVRDLVRTADVVLANFSPHALARLGLGYDVLSADNPGLIMVEMPALGNSGPWSAHVGMGKTMEAASGMARMIGYGDGVPVLTGPAYFDPIGGLHGAAAVLTALAGRSLSGRGQYVEVAQVEAALHWIGEFILCAAQEGRAFDPCGNGLSEAEPHEAFACAGNDQWAVIAVFDDATWKNLVETTQLTALAGEKFASLEGRKAHRNFIHQTLTSWTQGLNKHEVADRLQAAGIAAAPVNSGADVYRDPFLRAQGFIQQMDHPSIGPRDYPGLAYRLKATPGSMRRPSPQFAEHLDEVLTELGLSKDQITQLEKGGVIHRRPAAA